MSFTDSTSSTISTLDSSSSLLSSTLTSSIVLDSSSTSAFTFEPTTTLASLLTTSSQSELGPTSTSPPAGRIIPSSSVFASLIPTGMPAIEIDSEYDPESPSSSKKISYSNAFGIGIGCIAFLLFVGLIAFIVHFKRRQKLEVKKDSKGDSLLRNGKDDSPDFDKDFLETASHVSLNEEKDISPVVSSSSSLVSPDGEQEAEQSIPIEKNQTFVLIE